MIGSAEAGLRHPAIVAAAFDKILKQAAIGKSTLTIEKLRPKPTTDMI
jgi:uncharacterized protein (DUF3084 family)